MPIWKGGAACLHLPPFKVINFEIQEMRTFSWELYGSQCKQRVMIAILLRKIVTKYEVHLRYIIKIKP